MIEADRYSHCVTDGSGRPKARAHTRRVNARRVVCGIGRGLLVRSRG
jgi:hypothetical protein